MFLIRPHVNWQDKRYTQLNVATNQISLWERPKEIINPTIIKWKNNSNIRKELAIRIIINKSKINDDIVSDRTSQN